MITIEWQSDFELFVDLDYLWNDRKFIDVKTSFVESNRILTYTDLESRWTMIFFEIIKIKDLVFTLKAWKLVCLYVANLGVFFFPWVYVRLGQQTLLTRSSAYCRDGAPFLYEKNPLLPSIQSAFVKKLLADYTWCCRSSLFLLVNLIRNGRKPTSLQMDDLVVRRIP